MFLVVATAAAASGAPTAQEIIAKTQAAYAALSSYSDSGKVVSQMAGQTTTLTFDTQLERSNLYRINWALETGLKGAVWSNGNGDYLQINPGSPADQQSLAAISASGLKNEPTPQKMPGLSAALARATGISYSASSIIPGAFFNQKCGDVFVYPILSGRYPVQPEKDDAVGNVDCYVVSSEVDLSQASEAGKSGTVFATLWIGKSDFLVHQTRTRYEETVDEKAMSSDAAIDDAIKKSLEMQKKPATPDAIAAMRPQMRTIMKQVQSTLKARFKAGLVMTQTHENISVNRSFSPSDFVH
jgi:hypothetical protein